MSIASRALGSPDVGDVTLKAPPKTEPKADVPAPESQVPFAKDLQQVQEAQKVTGQTVSTGLKELPEATVDEFLAFAQTFGQQGASGIVRSGNALVLTVPGKDATTGPQAIKVPLSALSKAVESSIIDRHGALMHSLQIFEAAYNAGLSASATNAIVRSFSRHVADGTPTQAALLRALTNVAVAGQVEAYIENKNGLSSDIRRTAEFTKEAFDGKTAGGTLQALKNRTVRAEVIRTAQMHLDDKLHRFTDAVATARETGDYDQAFDAMERFFRTSAQVAETDYWRERPTSVLDALTSHRPPGPRDGQGPISITADVPPPTTAPRSLTLSKPQKASTTGLLGSIKETFQAIGQWLKGRDAVATIGTTHDGAAENLLAMVNSKGPVAVTGTRFKAPTDASAPSGGPQVLSMAYLLRFTDDQRKAIAGVQAEFGAMTTPLTTTKARQDYAAQAKAGVQKLVTAGIPEPEAQAIVAQFERRSIAVVNPDLATVVGNAQYDMAKDPTMTGLGQADVERYLKKLDHHGAIAAELRDAVTRFVVGKAGGLPKDANQAILAGRVTDRQIIDHLKANHPSLLKECHRALDVAKLPSAIRATAMADRPQTFDDTALQQLLGTTDAGQGPQTILDKILWNGASGVGASGGSDEVRGGYIGLSDSAVRMDHRAKLFSDLAFLVDQPDDLAGGIAMRRAKLNQTLAAAEQDMAAAKTAQASATTAPTRAKANFALMGATQRVAQLQRELHDLTVVETTLKAAVASGDPQSHMGFQTLKAIAGMSPLERFAIIAYTSELYSVVNGALRFSLPTVNSTDKPDLLAWTKATQSALNKLPSYTGTTYRQDASNARQNLLQADNEIGDKAFTSTASTLDGTQGAFQREMLAISKVTGGKVIADLSHFGSAEREVLMPPFSTFTVAARIDKPADGDWGKVLRQPENARLLADFGVDTHELESYLKGSLGRTTKTIALQQQI